MNVEVRQTLEAKVTFLPVDWHGLCSFLDAMPKRSTEKRGLHRIIYENGLSIVLVVCFSLFLIGQGVTGWMVYNSDQQEHQGQAISFTAYLVHPHFLEATMENWESEFLQMFFFIVLTALLYQKRSAESKKLDETEAVDRDPHQTGRRKNLPWPVQKGGFILKIYENSLSLAFLILFLGSFFLHAVGGAAQFTEEQSLHGQTERVSAFTYMATSRFWFESLQNWQSEFLAVGAMVVLTIFLRQRGSPESKPVDSPHGQTGAE